MLGRAILGRLSTKLSKTRTYDAACLSQNLYRFRNASNGAGLLLYRSHGGMRLFHVSIPGQAPRAAASARKSAKRGSATASKTTSKKAPKKRNISSRKSGGRKSSAPKVKKSPQKREPSEKAKAERATKKQRDHIEKLKEVALLPSEPRSVASTAWKILLADHTRGTKGPITATGAASRYRSLSPSEREHYNHLANENKATNESKYRDWVKSHTPEQIRQANRARTSLRRKLVTTLANPGHKKFPKYKGRVIRYIKDDRVVKRPVPAFFFFNKDRHQSGDMKSVPIKEAQSLVTNEWRALTPSERAKYESMADEECARYHREYKDVYGHDPPSKPSRKVTNAV